jgi:hypothetical protein
MAKQVGIVIDCADPGALARFWRQVLDYAEEPVPEGYATWAEYDAATGQSDAEGCKIVDPDGIGPTVFFQPVPEPKTVKNRVHLDVRVGGAGSYEERWGRIVAGVPPLVAIGAREVWQHPDPEDPFIVLADPEGNEFCLV